MKRILCGVWLLSCLLPMHAFSWNALGHRLIVQIAYDHLTSHAKQIFNAENQVLARAGRLQSLVDAATWLDVMRFKKDAYYDAMHYVDIPFSRDGSALPLIPINNAVSAIESAVRVLSTSSASPVTKGIALRILLHVVGDVHQPLHAITEVSRLHPKGDLGGNLVLLHKNPIAKNLHAYWDRGAGFLISMKHSRAPQIKKMATRLERRWPCQMGAVDLSPMQWAQESHALAISNVYALPEGNNPDKKYQRVGKNLVKQRIALAGCRLGGLMNQLAKESP